MSSPERETRSSGATVSGTDVLHSVVPPPYLDDNGINAALSFILGNWPRSAPMKAEQREAWLDVLCQLRQGELKAALQQRRDDPSYRPDPYVLLDIVLTMRAGSRIPKPFTPKPAYQKPASFDASAFCDQIRAENHLLKGNRES